MQSSFRPVTHKGQVLCSLCDAGQDSFVDREHLMNLGIRLRAQVVNCKGETASYCPVSCTHTDGVVVQNTHKPRNKPTDSKRSMCTKIDKL